MCAFGGKTNEKKNSVATTRDLTLITNTRDAIAYEKRLFRSQSNDGKKGKKRTTTDLSSNRTNHSNSKVPAPPNHARNHKSNKSNTKNNLNLNNDDNNGAGSLSIGSGPSVAPSIVHSSTNSTHTTSTTTTTTQSQPQSAIVKLSPAPSSTGSARTSSPIVNVTIMKKYRDEPSTSRTPDKPFGNPPTAGGLKFAFEPQQPPAGLVINTNATVVQHALKESPPSSPGSEASARKRRKGGNTITSQPSPHAFHADHKEKETKTILQNGAIPTATHHMLGNQLNPSSNVAKNMSDTLNMEIEAHSIYSHEPAPNLVGPQYPGRKDSVRVFFILSFVQF